MVAEGRAEAACAGPSRALANWVQNYTAYRERLVRPVRRQEAACLDVVLLISSGDPVLVPAAGARPGSETGYQSVLVTAHDRPMATVHSGRQEGFHVRMTPLAAYRLLAGAPVNESTNRVLDLPSVFGSRGELLVERMRAEPVGGRRVRLVEAALRAWLGAGPQPAPQVVRAWRHMRANRGNVSVQALVNRAGWSHRHFTNQFRRQVGVAPKTAARLLRFQYAVELLAERTESLAGVAAAVGYADQAHFTREFSALAGCLPSRFNAGSISFKTRSCPTR
ncbi:AraC family transcriptional regulator [Couchioplanes caeruleus]|uniref:helix-turn-helix domain-containing protein n=1 Tax=Couchioplanes caeruleus TaxID=56438 RepID=UPI0020BDDA43|nr:AraC family transcriptional regulator [Couchioplanes caeruleus]UQU62223.1 AraC family transcriptional regulator [Couchioplanes caeruleus]